MDCRSLINLTLMATLVCQAAGKLIMKPSATDIKVNHSTYLNCSTDYGPTVIFWFHGKNHVYTGSAIFEPYHERFEIDRDAWNGTYIYNLVIHSVQPGDAGEYICAEDEGMGERYSVQLVVLEDYPVCRSKNQELDEVVGQNTCGIEPDIVELECSVKYHGNIPPQMEWNKAGENISTPFTVSAVTSNNHFVSTLKFKGDIALGNSSYVCGTKRTTVKTYMYKCTSEVIKILYAVSGNSAINKTINDEIHCNANTSQSCIYKWKWLQDSDFTIESSTSVLKAKKPGWHRCEAECHLRNETCRLLVMRAMVSGNAESSRTTIILVAVAVVVTLVVVGGLIFALLRIFRKRAAGHESSMGSFQVSGKQKFATDHADLHDYLKEPTRAIYGLAVLAHEVFISRLQYSEIEVYDSTTFRFKRRMKVDGMNDPESIESCSVNNCLYAFDWKYKGQEEISEMLRIDPANGNLIKTWNVNGRGGRLSVASDANVILNINYESRLHEYRANGDLIRKINLDPDRTGIFRAWHALKLKSGLFVVCHGDYDDPLPRVCLLSIIANTCSAPGRTDEVEILKVFGGDKGELLKGPIYLSVDKKESIMVSDSPNKTVLLSRNLNKARIIVSEEDGLERSWRTCFDELTGQWFVSDHHRVMICRVKGKGVERKIFDVGLTNR